MTTRARLRVAVTDGRGRPRPAGDLPDWLARVAPAAAAGGEMVVALVSDGKMRALNRRFRGIGRRTDVLSFPADRGPRLPGRLPGSPGRLLGDVVIATGVAAQQARAAGHPLDVELRRLALHGLLHLLGYDHTRDNGRMARLERRLWRRGGLAEGAP